MERARPLKTYSHTYYARRELDQDGIRMDKLAVEGELPNQRHDTVLLVYCKGGSGWLTVNGVRMPLAAGMLARLFPFHIHSFTAADRQPLELMRCTFPLSTLLFLDVGKRHEEASYSVVEYSSPLVSLEPEEARRTLSAMEEMARELEEEKSYHMNMVLGNILRTLALFDRAAAASVDREAYRIRPAAWKALQFIHMHFNAEDMDSAMVARQFGTDPVKLGHILRTLTGQGFSANLHEVRVRNACAMMRFEELTIAYIARYVGYKSPATFHRVFKQLTGLTPEQYREGAKVSPPGALRDTAWNILIYLLEHYGEALNPSVVAEAFFISESTLHHIIQSNTGIGFAALLEQVRLTYACALLGTGKLQVYDIAIAVGYNSVRTFSRSFREVLGTTPVRYRERLAELLAADGG